MLPDIQLTSYWVKLSNFCKEPCLELSITQIPIALIVIIITGVIINVSSGDKWTWQICTNSPIVIVCVYVCTYTHTSDHNSLPTSKVKAFYFILWQALKKNLLFVCMFLMKVKVKLLSHVWFFALPWMIAPQAHPSMEFPRQEYCSAVSFSRGSSWLRDRTQFSHIVGRCFYHLSHQGSLCLMKSIF